MNRPDPNRPPSEGPRVRLEWPGRSADADATATAPDPVARSRGAADGGADLAADLPSEDVASELAALRRAVEELRAEVVGLRTEVTGLRRRLPVRPDQP